MIRLWLEGLPPSVNEIAFATVKASIKVRQRYKADLTGQLIAQGHVPGEPKLGSKERPVRIEAVYLIGPKARNRDVVSNMLKALQDALEAFGILSNDRFVKYGEETGLNFPRDVTLIRVYEIKPITLAEVEAWWGGPIDGDGHTV